MRTVFPAALAWLVPTIVAAQSTSLTPSFSVSETYDDNLFVSASHRQGSFVQGFGPRVQLDRLDKTFSLVGRYALDAEYLTGVPTEGIVIARQLGALDCRYQPMKHLTLKADAAYLETRSSVEFSPATALDRGRVPARRFSVGPTVGYAFDRRTHGDLGYTFSRDSLLGLTTDAHLANAAVAHQFTRLDTGSATVLVREYVFSGAALSPSEVALLGWTRKLAPRTSVAVQAGPRFRQVDPEGVEVAASLHQGIGRTELEASYTRAETATSGLPGSFETDAAMLSATVHTTRWKPSALQANAGFARTHGTELQADVLHTRLSALTQVHPWLSVELALSLSWQRVQTAPVAGTASSAASAASDSHMFHDIASLTLVVAPPKPLEL